MKREVRDVAASIHARFQPAPPIETLVLPIPSSDRTVIVLRAPRAADARPCTCDGRPYQRVGTTTSRIPQDR
jgi:hypothetical protein